MDERGLKIKAWSQAIRERKFNGIADEIKSIGIIHKSDEMNKEMNKLLIYLCQTTQQCDNKKKDNSDGANVLNIASAICSKLTSIPDVSKFFAAIYHIVLYLINVELYKEAMKLGDYLLPGSLLHAALTNSSGIYAKFSSLWHKTIEKLFSTFRKLDDKNFEFIMILINYELKFQALALEGGSKYFLNKIAVYNDEIKAFNQQQYDLKFKNAMINNIAHAKMSLGNEDKFQTYKSALRFLNEIIIYKINAGEIESINKKIKQYFAVFKNCMKEDDECYECFNIYEQLCQILIRHVNEFTTVHFSVMKTYVRSVDKIIEQYGNENAIKWNSYSIIKIFEALISFWEKEQNKNNKKRLAEELIMNLIELIKHQSDIFTNFHLSQCHCQKNDCRMTVDISNAVSMKIKLLTMIERNIVNLSTNIINITVAIAEQCIQSIYLLQAANCKRWCKLWIIIGSLIYNISVHHEKTVYDEIIRLYTHLATVTINLNAFSPESSYIEFDNPLNVALHRLSNTHYFHKKYDDAMIACALNAYVGYKDNKCKAFRFWAHIKYKYPSSHDITIINCLKSNKNVAQTFGIKIDLDNCDLEKICLREIMSLQGADIELSSSIIKVLDLMESINVEPLVYAQCVQRLGYHMLNFQSDISILKYINKGLSSLKSITKYTVSHELLRSHLKFYEFIEELKQISKITETEMQNSKIQLYAKSDANRDPTSNIVPGYSLINVRTTSRMAEKLEKILKIWMKYYKTVDIKTNKILEPDTVIQTAIVVAEYTRFYQYQNLEKQAWDIAHSLANDLNDDSAIVYITGRCILSRYIDHEWIQQAENICTNRLSGSTDQTVIETLAMFKLSLSEFYFDIGLTIEANQLHEEAIALPDIKFAVNTATYLLSLDILLSHKFNCDYIENIIKGLYTMLTIDNIGSIKRHQRKHFLYELDILFQFTNHIVLRMNNLISYREISAHLVQRLSIAQKLGASLHVAECLKNLCFIDLSRNAFEDCEVKLQGLEHILMVETVEMSMKNDFQSVQSTRQINVTSNRIIEPVRDIFHNDTSPILRTKVFASPNFMNHDEKCKCFNCSNTTYQYLVFSCTHIRAQLYAFQNYIDQALQHFYGAFEIIRKILKLSDEYIGVHRYHEIVEYVLFILDFARFLKHFVPPNVQDGLNIALHAVDVCEKYKLTNNPVYFTAKELIFEFRYQTLFQNIDFTKFTMPCTSNIDNNEYSNENDDESKMCATPVRVITTQSKSVRRRKTPPLLTLSKVTIDTIEDEDLNIDDLLPPFDNKLKEKKSVKVQPIRRKISEDDYLNNEMSDDFKSSCTLGKKNVREIVGSASDNSSEKQLDTPKNIQTTRKRRQKIIASLDDLSDKSESVDKVTEALEKIQVTDSSTDNRGKIKSSNTTQSSCKYVPKNESANQKNSCSSNKNTNRKLSSEKKGNDGNDPLPADSSLEFLSTSSRRNNDQSSRYSNSDLDSDNDVVECSILEPRRSRRIAGQTKKS